jgi:hypothetical protein
MTLADRKAGEGSLASSLAPPGAPSPRKRGTEKWETGNPGRPKTKMPGGEALARRLRVLFENRIGSSCVQKPQAAASCRGLTGHPRSGEARTLHCSRILIDCRVKPGNDERGRACRAKRRERRNDWLASRSRVAARLVPLAGIEPARCCHHQILSLARLPVPPQGLCADHRP